MMEQGLPNTLADINEKLTRYFLSLKNNNLNEIFISLNNFVGSIDFSLVCDNSLSVIASVDNSTVTLYWDNASLLTVNSNASANITTSKGVHTISVSGNTASNVTLTLLGNNLKLIQ